MQGVRSIAGAVALVAALAVAGCAAGGHVEGRLTYPPPRRPGEAPLPEPHRRPARPPAPGERAPAGIYFLHETAAGLERCTYMGERVTGSPAPLHRPEADRARHNALLELAREAHGLGGNVVLLPSFAEDYRSGRVVGRIYRCDEAQRGAIYRRAAAEQRLTILSP